MTKNVERQWSDFDTQEKRLWEIFVPVCVGGKKVSKRKHQRWDAVVRDGVGGLTIFRPAKGHWVSPDNELFVEPMIPVRIHCTAKQMYAIAVMTRGFFDQQKVMYYEVSANVELV